MPFQTVRTGMPVVQASAAISTGTGASEEKIGMALVGVGESRGPGRRHVVNGHRQRQTARLDFTRFGGPNEMRVDEVCAETLREFQHRVGAGRWIIEHVGEIGEIFRLGKSEPRGTAEGGDTNAHVLAAQFLREIESHALGTTDLDGGHELQDVQRYVVVGVECGQVDGAEASVANESLQSFAERASVFQQQGQSNSRLVVHIHATRGRQRPWPPGVALQIAAAAREVARPS